MWRAIAETRAVSGECDQLRVGILNGGVLTRAYPRVAVIPLTVSSSATPGDVVDDIGVAAVNEILFPVDRIS